MDDFFFQDFDVHDDDDDDEPEFEAVNNTPQLSDPTTSIISHGDWNELTNMEQPDVSDWNDYPSNFDGVKKIDVCITFDEATRSAWETAKEEIHSI
jgi:hypothetical protein